MMIRKTLVVALLLGQVFIIGCGKDDARPAAGAAAAPVGSVAGAAGHSEPPRPVRYIQVGLSPLGEGLILPGEVRPRFEQRYGFRVGGKIAQRFVDVGQQVTVGQVLAVLDAQDALPAINAQAAQVEVARSDVTLQQSELKRLEELRDKGFVSAAALERQTAAAEAAQARLRAGLSQLANAQNGLLFQTLRADHAGVVTAVDAEAGSVVAAGQSVVRVAQLGEKEIAIHVPERAVGQMKAATGFAVSLDALGNSVYRAKLRELAPLADPASRTYAVRLTLANADEALQLGMSATVRVELGTGQAILVPTSALYTRDDVTRVWVVDRATQTVRPVAVNIGANTGDGVVIVAGLKPGDLVVTAGANLLLAGQQVRLLEPSPEPARPAPSAAPALSGSTAASAAPVRVEARTAGS